MQVSGLHGYCLVTAYGTQNHGLTIACKSTVSLKAEGLCMPALHACPGLVCDPVVTFQQALWTVHTQNAIPHRL